MKAIRVHEVGGADVLRWEEVPDPVPGPLEVRVRIEAAGVNFIDVYHRTGLYAKPLPLIPGMEGAGTIDQIGSEVTEFRPGDRVGFALGSGIYAEMANVAVEKLIPLPSGVDAQRVAAVLLQGMTADYLVRGSFYLKKNDTALVHAAAGGVGLLLTQMAKRIGARVIGTVSNEEKARLARAAGADEVILYEHEDFEARVLEITGGSLCEVVYDSVGKRTFDKSMRCLKPLGYLVSYGQSSGSVPPLDISLLSTRGSLFLTRPTLGHYTATRATLLERAGRVLGMVESGALDVRIHQTYPLSAAATAHRDLEGRKTTGKLILVPDEV